METASGLAADGGVGRRLRRVLNDELNQWSYNRQALATLGEPVVFQIELTNHCPMACVMCPRTKSMTRPLGYMDEALFQRIIREMSAYTSKVFLHHFGDSLVHPGLGPFIRYARDHGVKSYLSTNPALLTESRSKELVDSGLHELVLSLDGLTPDTSAAVRGKAARNVLDAERKIAWLVEYRHERQAKRPYLIMQFVRQQMNQHETREWLAKWTAAPGIDAVKVKSYVAWDGQDARINALRISTSASPDAVVCDKPWTSVTILWDGRVVPCCFDYDGKCLLGDLREASLREIWRGARMQALRRAHRDGALCGVDLCARCTDKEGYPVGKWYYPLNRLFLCRTPLADRDDRECP